MSPQNISELREVRQYVPLEQKPGDVGLFLDANNEQWETGWFKGEHVKKRVITKPDGKAE